MTTCNGIIENSTGDLLQAAGGTTVTEFNQVIADYPGYSSGTHSVRTDVPCPFKVKGDPGFSVYQQWNGSSWDEIAQ